MDHPVVVHIHTDKGHGWKPAEEDKETWHFSSPFDLKTGSLLNSEDEEDYSDIFHELTSEMMKEDPSFCVLTAGTPGVVGYGPDARKAAGRQFIDVGIAEQEAVAMASGLAKSGAHPVFGVVSSFIQRAYDQLAQDVAVNDQPVALTIMYGSVLGMNDVTHLGWFDIPLISNIPNWVFLAPVTKEEYVSMQKWAVKQRNNPVCIKIPGGPVRHSSGEVQSDWSDLNKFLMTDKGRDVAIIGAGTFFPLAEEVAGLLEKNGIKPTVINPRYLSGLDEEMLESLKSDHSLVITLEDGVLDGGFGEKVARFYGPSDMKVKCYGLKKQFLDRYDYGELLQQSRLTAPQITGDVLALLK